VYLLAYEARSLAGKPINIGDVYYVGMSNAAGGVKARLKQFKKAIETGHGHSAGKHFYMRHKGTPFSKLRVRERFYFAALCLPCVSLKKNAPPSDFKKMGHVACLEYFAIAHVQSKRADRKVPALNRSAGGILMDPAVPQNQKR
jgi:hypothetical protein